jgi:pimeloyl-ACP methyl ester carboxylesterase
MGGGGALRAGVIRPSLKAVIGAAPWNDQPDFSTLTVPTLIVACQNDSIAPVAQHASPIYDSIPRTVPSEYIEIAGEDHFCVTTNNTNVAERTAIARQVISFLKRYVDSDTRYDTFLCPAPAVGGVISDSRSTCAS